MLEIAASASLLKLGRISSPFVSMLRAEIDLGSKLLLPASSSPTPIGSIWTDEELFLPFLPV